MRSRLLSPRARWSGAAILVAILATADGAAAQSDRGALSRDAFDALVHRVDNAGRWGAGDQSGTLNHITPEVRRAAAAEVRAGLTISLGREFVAGAVEGAFEPAGIDFLIVSDSLLGPSDGSAVWTAERLTIIYHGWAFSHVDAPSHISYKGRGYNGPATRSAAGEPERNRVDAMRDGIVTRGVLVDVPRLRDVPFVEGSAVVTPADLTAWEERTGVRVGAGDVVLFRGGRGSTEAARAGASAFAALHPTAAEWLHERGVAAVGVDASADPGTSLVAGITSPFHVLALVAMGMPIFENLDLEVLAGEAANRSQWTFMFVAAPLDIRGGTGSPLNPLAVF
ncbi:MAG TPA: cyclase family protein [Longimicrobiales bacterium]|nr:cyclase family protein [Longimicrobiales bacterium]